MGPGGHEGPGGMPPMGGPGADDMLGMDMMDMIKDTPIKAITSFAGPSFTGEMLDAFLDNLNKIQQSRK
jgi:hypothetical protein